MTRLQAVPASTELTYGSVAGDATNLHLRPAPTQDVGATAWLLALRPAKR
jgi:hypothetical protein